MSLHYGAFPDNWVRARIDRVSSVSARIGWKALTAAEYQPEGYAFLATPNIKSREIDFENVNFISQFRYDESPELKLAVGDVLLVKDGNTLGICNVVRDLPRPATVNGSIAILRPHGVDSRFLHYALLSYHVQRHIQMVKDGMGVPHLFQRDIKRIEVPLPPIEEQRRIADFLDAETARIDRLVELYKRTGALVAEKEQAVRDVIIDKAFESHGSLPLRRLARAITQGSSPPCDNIPAAREEWGVLKLSSVKRGVFKAFENKRLPDGVTPDKRQGVQSGDLLITRANTPDLVGDAAIAEVDGRKLLLPDLIYRLDLLDGVLAPFVLQFILSTRIRQLVREVARGSSQSMVKLRGEDILAWPVPKATSKEQRDLVTEIEDGSAHFARVSVAIQRQLLLLAERRQAVITAAVTGQFDVTTGKGADLR